MTRGAVIVGRCVVVIEARDGWAFGRVDCDGVRGLPHRPVSTPLAYGLLVEDLLAEAQRKTLELIERERDAAALLVTCEAA